MSEVLPYLIGIAAVAVVLVLFAGIFTMARGGEFNRKYGNRLMRWRVGLQLLAVVLLLLYLLSRTA